MTSVVLGGDFIVELRGTRDRDHRKRGIVIAENART